MATSAHHRITVGLPGLAHQPIGWRDVYQTTVPRHRPEFAYWGFNPATGRGGWRASKRDDDSASRLSLARLRKHLDGKAVAPKWSLRQTHNRIVFDLDARGPGGLVSAWERMCRVLHAIGLTPEDVLIIRSSASWGLHVYVFLTDWTSGARIRRLVVEQLAHHGIGIAPGEIEVWPANNYLRAPFGPGSFVLSPGMLPMFAEPDRAGRFRRDLQTEISHAVIFAREHRHDLRALTRDANRDPLTARHHENGGSYQIITVTNYPPDPPKVPAPAHGPPIKGSEYKARVRQLMRGVPGHGLRNATLLELGRVVFGYMAHDEDEGTQILTDWIDNGVHISKDFERSPDRTRRTMKAAIPKIYAYIQRAIAKGDIIPGLWRDKDAQMEKQLSPRTMLAGEVIDTAIAELGPQSAFGWRDILLRKHLTDDERDAVAELSRNVRKLVSIMLALTRWATERFPDKDRWAFGTDDMRRIYSCENTDDLVRYTGLPAHTSPGRLMFAALERYGVIREKRPACTNAGARRYGIRIIRPRKPADGAAMHGIRDAAPGLPVVPTGPCAKNALMYIVNEGVDAESGHVGPTEARTRPSSVRAHARAPPKRPPKAKPPGWRDKRRRPTQAERAAMSPTERAAYAVLLAKRQANWHKRGRARAW